MDYRFLLDLAIILLATKLLGLLMKKLGLPQVVGGANRGHFNRTRNMVAAHGRAVRSRRRIAVFNVFSRTRRYYANVRSGA